MTQFLHLPAVRRAGARKVPGGSSFRRRFRLGLFLPAALAVICMAGSPQVNAVEPTEFVKLEVLLTSERESYVIGEPIALRLEVRNATDYEVRCPGFAWWSHGGVRSSWVAPQYLDLYISSGREKQRQYEPNQFGFADGPPDRRFLDPCSSRCAKYLITADDRWATLLEPGTIEIQARFLQTNSSNAIRVLLKSPGNADAESLRWLRDRKLLPLLGYQAAFAEDERELVALQQFLADRPEGVYSPYVRFALGQMYRRFNRFDDAIRVLKPLAVAKSPMTVSDDVLFLLADSHYNKFEGPDAERWFLELLERFPNSPAVPDVHELLERVAELPGMLFRDDRSLDVLVSYDFPQPTPLEDVFSVISAGSGVQLRLAPEWKAATMTGGRNMPKTVRRFMETVALTDGLWVREKDGYLLIRVREAAPKRPAKRTGAPAR